MLEFRHIAHAYNGNESVRDVSFAVNAGEVVTLLGPSGCGKTTPVSYTHLTLPTSHCV